jgi:hypothetical protein
MSRLGAALDVAADYAYHLYSVDGVPQAQAVSVGAASVVRAIRANPSKFVTPRTPAAPDNGLGWSGQALSLVGSSLSVIGLLKTLFGGG